MSAAKALGAGNYQIHGKDLSSAARAWTVALHCHGSVNAVCKPAPKLLGSNVSRAPTMSQELKCRILSALFRDGPKACCRQFEAQSSGRTPEPRRPPILKNFDSIFVDLMYLRRIKG